MLLKNLTLVLLLLISTATFSKDTLTMYYDKDWYKTRKKSEAHFYRKIYKKEKKVWVAKDYFIDGQLQMVGQFTSKNGKTRIGNFIYYYENGGVESKGTYRNDSKDGEWVSYHENGKISAVGSYVMWDKHGKWAYYYDNGNEKSTGSFFDGYLNGVWDYYFESGMQSARVVYEMGEDTKVQYWDEKGVEQKEDLELEIQPEFPGGENEMIAFISNNFEYPEEALMRRQKGTVYIEFVVTKYGFLEDVKVVKGVSKSLDEECMRVISEMPDWKPGKQFNKEVNVRYTIPIKCRIGK